MAKPSQATTASPKASAAGIDLDTVKAPGVYEVFSALNGPNGITDMYVYVLSTPRRTPTFNNVVQHVRPNNGSHSFVRYFNGSSWSAWTCDAPTSNRDVLTANRTYYVRADGSDSNNGLANTAAGAFLTMQKAFDTLNALDIGNFNVWVRCGTTGSFGNAFLRKLTIQNVGTGQVHIIGGLADGSDKASYVLGGVSIYNTGGGFIDFQGFTMASLFASAAKVTLVATNFSGGSGSMIQATNESDVAFGSGTVWNAPATPGSCITASGKSKVSVGNNFTISNTPAFTTAAYNLSGGSRIVLSSGLVHSSTGRQYNRGDRDCVINGVIGVNSTPSGVLTNLPGNQAPSTIYEDFYITGVIESPANGDYDIQWNVPGNFRIVNFRARTWAGSAVVQLRKGGSSIAQGTAIGSTINAQTGTPNFNDTDVQVCGGDHGLTLTLSSVSAASKLYYEVRLERIGFASGFN